MLFRSVGEERAGTAVGGVRSPQVNTHRCVVIAAAVPFHQRTRLPIARLNPALDGEASGIAQEEIGAARHAHEIIHAIKAEALPHFADGERKTIGQDAVVRAGSIQRVPLGPPPSDHIGADSIFVQRQVAGA